MVAHIARKKQGQILPNNLSILNRQTYMHRATVIMIVSYYR